MAMSEWQTGDVITAERLNAMVPMIVNVVTIGVGPGFDKTWQEVTDALNNKRIVLLDNNTELHLIYQTYEDEGTYGVQVFSFYLGSTIYYTCSNPDGYPMYID